jgi:hypothetical protein
MSPRSQSKRMTLQEIIHENRIRAFSDRVGRLQVRSKSDLELYREAMALADLVEGYWIVAAPHGS